MCFVVLVAAAIVIVVHSVACWVLLVLGYWFFAVVAGRRHSSLLCLSLSLRWSFCQLGDNGFYNVSRKPNDAQLKDMCCFESFWDLHSYPSQCEQIFCQCRIPT